MQLARQYNVLLIGDSCTDEWVYGSCDRLSPEGPIPVMKYQEKQTAPGMAANVNENLKSLGINVNFITNKEKITKTRYVHQRSNQQVMRLDTEPEIEPIKQHQIMIAAMHQQYDAIVVSDCGANLCWVYQIFRRTKHKLFTAAGHSPMGYTLPAMIGAALSSKEHQVIGFIGDGGFQMNIQELQTIVHYQLNTKIIVLNNFGYGIIKQFQDSYFDSRYEASGKGYSQPDFRKIANAFNIKYYSIKSISDLKIKMFENQSAAIVDVFLDPNTLIEPKIELGHPINNQFPYLGNEERKKGNKFLNE